MRRVLLGLALSWSALASAAEPASHGPDAGMPGTPAMDAGVAAAPAGPPAVMLVWGGGATREAADAALKDYQKRFKPMRGALVPGDDFPRVLESATVPGMKPGFFVVALGVCAPGDADAPLAAYKGIEPNVYAREVTWPVAEGSCPTVGEHWTGPTIHRVKKKGLELTGVLFSYQETMEGGEFENKGWWLLLHLRDGKGKVLETQLVFPEAEWSDLKSFDLKGNSLVVSDEYASPSCLMNSFYTAYKRSITFTIDGQEIGRGEKERKVGEGSCGGG